VNNILYLCEKPSQARALAKVVGANTQETGAYVGTGVIVTHCRGHMQQLVSADFYTGTTKWKLSALPIVPSEWQWEVVPDQQAQFDNIGMWLNRATSIVIATDPDEEGEVIGRQVLKAHRCTKPCSRLWASALDQSSLQSALKRLYPLSSTDSFYRAGMIRRQLDWLFGINLSRVHSLTYGCTANIGRVKTKLIEELYTNEKIIGQYEKQFHDVASITIGDDVYKWIPTSSIFPLPLKSGKQSTAGCEFIGVEMEGACVSSIAEDEFISPPLPFSLSTLLIQTCEEGIPLTQAYAAIQSLYERGAISYPRTSSHSMPRAGAGFAAHHAIVATISECPDYFDEGSHQIFEMIKLNGVMQSLGSTAATKYTTTFNIDGELFTNVTRVVKDEKDAGWLRIEQEALSKMKRQPATYDVDQKVRANPNIQTLEIPPPRLFTEGALLRLMMEKNIGTEATRVSAISSLTKDRVATLRNSEFMLTPSGRDLFQKLPAGISDEMARQIRDAVAKVRNFEGLDGQLMATTTTWLKTIIQGLAVA